MKLFKIKNSKRGQTSVEYILIIAVVVGVIMMFGDQLNSGIKKVTQSLFQGADRNVSSLTDRKN